MIQNRIQPSDSNYVIIIKIISCKFIKQKILKFNSRNFENKTNKVFIILNNFLNIKYIYKLSGRLFLFSKV